MTDVSHSAKRAKHDFSSTFDILVGQLHRNQKRFTVHTDLLTQRSRFLAAARKDEWLAGDATKPVDLSDEDPDVFQAYLNCVYIGPETLEEIGGAFEREVRGNDIGFADLFVYNICQDVTKEKLITEFERFGKVKTIDFGIYRSSEYESCRIAVIGFTTDEAGAAAFKSCGGLVLHGHRLTFRPSRKSGQNNEEYQKRRYELAGIHFDTLMKLYLLADKLQDMATVNVVIDKIVQFYKVAEVHPGKAPVSAAYQYTTQGSPLRKLLRNMWFFDTNPGSNKRFQEKGFPNDFLHDVMELYMKVKITEYNETNKYFDMASNDAWLDDSEREIPVQCRYHQHDDNFPMCPTSWKDERHCLSCRAAREL